MRAVVITEPGGPEVLTIREVARPKPGPRELLVRVQHAGVNRADLLQRRGRYPVPPGWPEEIPGLEVAGVVDEVGERCERFAPGDRVMAIVGGGGYAEYIALDERTALPVPATLDDEAAGAVPEVFLTAFDAAVLQAGLRDGETLLVHAVGSGVGTAAVQLARARGAETVGTSRTPDKLVRAVDLGLHHAIPADGWAEQVLEVTDGRGVDVVLDLVGGAYAADNLRVLAEHGRWVVVGVPSGVSATLDLRKLMRRRASITGTVLRARPLEEKIELTAAFERDALPLFSTGGARAVVDAVYPAGEAAIAHRRMEENLNFGKIVLRW